MAITITCTSGTPAANTSGKVEALLTVICKQNATFVKDEAIKLFIANNLIEEKITDKFGKVVFTITCPLNATEIKGEVKSSPNNGQADWKVAIPATAGTATPPPVPPTTPPPSSDPNDPAEMQVLRTSPTVGEFRLFTRVLNFKGKGLSKKTVDFIFQGKRVRVKTDSGGVCQFPEETEPPLSIRPGQEEKVIAFVSGISQLTTSNVCRRREITQEMVAKAKANNRRTRIFFSIAGIGFAAWLIFSIITVSTSGWGESLLSEISSNRELTTKESFYSSIPGYTDINKNTEVNGSLGYWQKTAVFLPFSIILLWTIFSFLYGIISMREEVAEAWSIGLEAMTNKHFVKTQDPLFERMAAWSGHFQKVSTPSTSPTPTATGTASKPGFFDYFRADILSDIIVEILPKVFRAIFGGK